jgi:hypothetical protein
MPLIIETGTGAANSEAYADAAALDAWAVLFYGAALDGTTAAKEAAIRRAVAFLEAQTWVGIRKNGRAQALAWPRTDAMDRDNNDVSSTTVPTEIIQAQHAFARAELLAPDVLTPQVTLAGRKVLTGVKGITWQVTGVSGSVEAERAVITMAMDRIKGLIIGGATTFLDRA